MLTDTWHFFSVPVLLKTLFAPWKRTLRQSSSSGWSMEKAVDILGFNLASRWVGLLVRSALVVFAVLAVTVIGVVGAAGLAVWLAVPVLSRPIYRRLLKHPSVFTSDLVRRMRGSEKPQAVLWTSEAGKFVLDHVGVNKEAMVKNEGRLDESVLQGEYGGMGQVVAELVNSGVWPTEWWRQEEINPEDLVLAAQIWDRKREQEADVNGASAWVAKGIGAELLYGYTPLLDKYGAELRLAGDRPKLVGRDEVLDRLSRVVESKSSAFVVGLPGVGKGAVLRELAYRLDHKYLRVVEVAMGATLAGAETLGEKKNLVSAILTESAAAGNVVLVVRDLARVINPMAEGVDLTDVVEQKIERRRVTVLAVATPEDYEKFVVPNGRLLKHFERVEIGPLDREAATAVLLDRAAKLETQTGIVVTIPALRKIIQAGQRYFSEVPFPKIALELLDSLAGYSKHTGNMVMKPADVEAVVAEKTGIPLTVMTGAEKKKLANIEAIMKQRLVGQETAVNMIGRSLRARAMGMSDDSRPVGTFLFLGPTGVGKTETAKVLSDAYFGHTKIIRFDMAEYVGWEGLAKLIGSTTMNQPGLLTTAIKKSPAGMLLLDELEKASSEVFNALLTLLDEGYINDAFGRRVDGRNLFVIATSNAGSEFVRQMVAAGSRGEQLQRDALEHVLQSRVFAPEFLNRFDGVVVYEPLDPQHMVEIARLQLGSLRQRLLEKNNIYLDLTEEVVHKLAAEGYDPLFGARPMRRVVDLVIGDLLSQAILAAQVGPGERIRLHAQAGKHEYNWSK